MDQNAKTSAQRQQPREMPAKMLAKMLAKMPNDVIRTNKHQTDHVRNMTRASISSVEIEAPWTSLSQHQANKS